MFSTKTVTDPDAEHTGYSENKKDIIQCKLYITSKGLKNSSAKLFQKDTVLIAMYGATAGQVGVLKFESSTNQAVCGILPNDKFCSEFLYYKFLAGKEALVSQAVGGAQPNISQIKIKNTLIPIIPLPEQKRIVAILDKVFVYIEKAKANAEQNLKNAKELFESYLQSVFENKGDDWEEKELGEVCKMEKVKKTKNNLIYVGMEHIESDTGKFTGRLEPSEVKSDTFHFTKNHILYGRLRPYLNKVLLPSFDGHCSTEVFPLNPSKTLYKNFLFYWFIKKSTVDKINRTCTGARMPRANMNEVMKFVLYIPNLTEQKTIVSKLDSLSAETKKLEAIYKQKIDDLNELKKSVLQKAFNGELNTLDEVIV